MTTIRRQILLYAVKLFDLVLMVGSFLLATLLIVRGSGAMSLSDFFAMRIKVGNFVLFCALLVLWHASFSGFGLYNSRRLSSCTADAVDTFGATTVGTLLIAVAAVAFRIRMISPGFLLVFWATATTVMVSQRLFLHSLRGRIRLRGRNLRNMLIVGTNSRALELTAQIEARPELGYRIMGFVDREWTGLQNFKSSGYSVVSDFDNLPSFLRTSVVDEVVIALPIASLHKHAAKIA